MKILLTGSNGLLGQSIARLCETRDHIQLLRSSNGPDRMIQAKAGDFHSLDITQSDEVANVVGRFKPDVIINTAAMTNVDQCETQQEACWKANVHAVKYLLDAAIKNQAHLLHLSTDFVFDGLNGPYSENDQPNPLSYYGQSKYQAEQILLQSNYEHVAIARTIIVYGKADQLSRGNIIFWVRDMLRENKEITIVDDQFRSPTWSYDLAHGCLSIAESRKKGIYHLSGPETMSIYELACKTAEYYGLNAQLIKPVKTGVFTQPAKRPLRTGFNIEKARRELNYQPHTLFEALDKMGEGPKQ